jgi:hypothetical protein
MPSAITPGSRPGTRGDERVAPRPGVLVMMHGPGLNFSNPERYRPGPAADAWAKALSFLAAELG